MGEKMDRKAMYKLSYGLFILTAMGTNGIYLWTAGVFMHL